MYSSTVISFKGVNCPGAILFPFELSQEIKTEHIKYIWLIREVVFSLFRNQHLGAVSIVLVGTGSANISLLAFLAQNDGGINLHYM